MNADAPTYKHLMNHHHGKRMTHEPRIPSPSKAKPQQNPRHQTQSFIMVSQCTEPLLCARESRQQLPIVLSERQGDRSLRQRSASGEWLTGLSSQAQGGVVGCFSGASWLASIAYSVSFPPVRVKVHGTCRMAAKVAFLPLHTPSHTNAPAHMHTDTYAPSYLYAL